MKRYILNIIIFSAIVTVIDVCIGGLGDFLQANARGGDTKQFDDLVSSSCHDVVILGSSRAHHHYDTPFLSDTLGLDVYNAGYDGNGVILSYGILEMVLERYKPQLVLFDVEPTFDIYDYKLDNNHIRYIHYLKPYYRKKAINKVIKDISCEEWYKVHSGLIRYNSMLISKAVDYYRSGDMEKLGYKPLNGKYTIVVEGKKEDEEDKQLTVDLLKLEYIEKLIKTTKLHKIPIVFIASPKYGKENSQELQPVKDICERNNIEFLDYYVTADYQNPRFFKEPTHLNVEGARVFSRAIAKEIKNRYFLITKRNVGEE